MHGYYRVCTSPGRFAEHMQWLADWGYRGVSVADGLAWLRKNSPHHDDTERLSDRRPVSITFDDGYLDNYIEAFPVLQRHGFSATIYLPTAFIGKPGNRCDFKKRGCLDWNEVRSLHAAGIEIGSHTVNHPKLVDLPPETVHTELRDSKLELESQLGDSVGAFAYPFAFPDANTAFKTRLRRSLHQLNYRSCVTTAVGSASEHSDDYQLPRYPANEVDDRRFFRAKLESAYDWFGWAQGHSKRARVLMRSAS